jgi:hypothetical protein
MRTGRPTKYKKEYCEEIIAFFGVDKTRKEVKAVITGKNEYEKTEYETVPNDLPTFAKFARKIGVNGDTLVKWAKKNKDFTAAYNMAKELQKEFLVDNGLAGLYPPASFIFTAKNVTDMRDKTETDITSGGKKIQPILGGASKKSI